MDQEVVEELTRAVAFSKRADAFNAPPAPFFKGRVLAAGLGAAAFTGIAVDAPVWEGRVPVTGAVEVAGIELAPCEGVVVAVGVSVEDALPPALGLEPPEGVPLPLGT